MSESSSEDSDDSDSEDQSEEYIPKLVHDAKTGCVEGRRRQETLFLVEWEGYPNESEFSWEPRDHFGSAHVELADDFVKVWKEAGKPWPPPRAT